MKKFDIFESAENVRSSNVVEFECELRHIPSCGKQHLKRYVLRLWQKTDSDCAESEMYSLGWSSYFSDERGMICMEETIIQVIFLHADNCLLCQVYAG